jgi:acyl-CoA thioester hydrolase
MKPSPRRQDPSIYPRHDRVPMRFSDIDMFRHLNNVAAGQFYEEARYAILADAREQAPRQAGNALVVAHIATSFLRQGRYPGTILVCSGVAEIGLKSLVIAQALVLEDVCIGTADTTIVAVDSAGS